MSGDCVAAFWVDANGNYVWFLANVVQTSYDDSAVLLSYFKKNGQDNEGEIWAPTEVLELLETDTYQVIGSSSDVSYVCCISK